MKEQKKSFIFYFSTIDIQFFFYNKIEIFTLIHINIHPEMNKQVRIDAPEKHFGMPGMPKAFTP